MAGRPEVALGGGPGERVHRAPRSGPLRFLAHPCGCRTPPTSLRMHFHVPGPPPEGPPQTVGPRSACVLPAVRIPPDNLFQVGAQVTATPGIQAEVCVSGFATSVRVVTRTLPRLHQSNPPPP
mmetsp:Transcript_19869/g.35444  ORF Transcript_19869/g.35444 Transcript_19869/m.35444 type:complete len:123 (-) Transcript_19869:50-418(-)